MLQTETRSALESKQQKFNRFLDIKDPAEFLGINLPSFSISLVYPLEAGDRERLKAIQRGIYERIVAKLNQESLGDVKYFVRDYQDAKVPYEPSRRYLKIEFSTPRATQVTSLVRCLVIGDNLYIGLDSYILGGLKVTAFIVQIMISLARLYLPLNFFPPFSILVLIYLFVTWIDVYRATRQKSDLLYALRCKFNKSADLGSFNGDDAVMYLKALLPIVTSTTKEVFKENGLNIESIADTLKSIEQKAIGQTISMEAGGNISLFGVNVGSYNSQASS